MNMTYRTRRRLQRIGLVTASVLTVAVLAWFCWVVWLERYVVYTREGATVDFDAVQLGSQGVVASPPEAKGNVPIYFNEGTDAIDVGRELTAIDGYYITYEDLSKNIAGVMEDLKYIKSGTPIMIELKGTYGSFYYTSNLSDAVPSASVSIPAVDDLIKELQHRGFYLIAKVSAFADYNFGLNHVPSGLYMLSRAGLWQDPDNGAYWMNPKDSAVISWITTVVLELKGLGFHEVMLSNFRFPVSDKYIYNEDKDAALRGAAEQLTANCSSDYFTLSFGVTSADFPLATDQRTRLYLEGVDAKDVAIKGAQMTLENPETRLVFLAPTNDSRFNQYSVLHPISSAEVLEAQKAEQASE